MRGEIKEAIIHMIYFYLTLNFFAMCFRMAVGFDCENRYVDYILPLSKIFCEVRGDK